jgi:hypothetical protein
MSTHEGSFTQSDLRLRYRDVDGRHSATKTAGMYVDPVRNSSDPESRAGTAMFPVSKILAGPQWAIARR